VDTGYTVGRIFTQDPSNSHTNLDLGMPTTPQALSGTVYSADVDQSASEIYLSSKEDRLSPVIGSVATSASASVISAVSDIDGASCVTSRTSISSDDWLNAKESIQLLPKETLDVRYGPFISLLGRLYDAHLLMGSVYRSFKRELQLTRPNIDI
jgi:hypothetical protein